MQPQIRIHDSHVCNCEWCQWAEEQQRRQGSIDRRAHLQQLRKSVLSEVDRLYLELKRIDDEVEALEK